MSAGAGGGVLDFRQPGDPPDVAGAIWQDRILRYYRTRKEAMRWATLRAAARGELPLA